MRFFRHHILQLTGICAMLGSVFLYFLIPIHANNEHEVFTNWLQSHLKSQEENTLRAKITELPSPDEEIESLIRKASALVKQHTGDFVLPLPGSEDEEDVFRVLLFEWNSYQDLAKGMGKSAIIENVKPNTFFPTNGLVFSGKISSGLKSPLSSAEEYLEKEIPGAHSYYLIPLHSGTAIGAP